ncbi:protease SohB [candidate division KSB1 bacterium]|nr:protease SohB [candidate division KSB1 bacterium]
MEMLKDYGLFLAKAVTIVVAIVFIVRGLIAAVQHEREVSREKVTVKKLNRHYEYLRDVLQEEMSSVFDRKQIVKAKKQQWKDEKKKAKAGTLPERKRIFVLTFKGDMRASAVSSLREEITAVLTVAKPSDEVVVRLESSGGVVHAYGLAASQLQRLKGRQIPLTIAVDKVAASGGYLMACVADRILAAPFAIVGSIGVISQVPNFNRLLKKHDIDYEEITAGEYKRTLSILGENTEKGRQKFIEQIEEVHASFKDFLQQHRTKIEIDAISTGEYWYGKRALELKLVDELVSSDDYLFAAHETCDIYEITYKPKETLREKLAVGIEESLQRAVNLLWKRAEDSRYV